MLKSLFRIILLALLAWFISPVLNVIIPLPTESMVDGFLDLSIKKDRTVFEFLRYVVWIIALALIFKFSRPLFGFLLPTAKRYSTTKPMRRFQGMFAEVFLIGLVVLGVGLFISAWPAYEDYSQSYSERHYEVLNNGSLYWENYTKKKSDLERELRYTILVRNKKPILDKLNILEHKHDSTMVVVDEYVRVETLEKHGGAVNLLFSTFKDTILITILLSIIIYVLLRYAGRSSLGKRFEKLLRFFEQGRFGRGGSARFAGLFEEWGSLYKSQKQGLFMGRSIYNPFLNIGLEDSRHMMTIAGSRGGKGATSIIPNLLLWEGTALVIDPKGTNAAVTARRRREMGQNVHIIDPFNILEGEKTAQFNPLELLDENSPHIREQISMIAEALVVPDKNQKEKHWDDGAKTILAGMIGHLVSDPRYEDPNLSMLRDMLSTMPDQQAELWADMSLNDGAGRLAKDAAHRVIRGISTNEISSIISNADKHTEWLSSPAMKHVLGASSFKFSELKDKPTTIYLILPPEYLETHNRFLRLFVNLALSQMSVGGRAKVPVLMLMDEFLALGRMEEVEKAFGLMAGYNLVMWPFVQDLGRLKDLYGKSVNAFIANSRAVQVFGVADEETKEFISKYIGDRIEEDDVKLGQGKRSVKLRQANEVAIDIAAETGRQYILRSGKAPMVLEKVPYYNGAPIKTFEDFPIFKKASNGLFDGLYDKDPDYIKK